MSTVYLNGEFLPLAEARVSVLDRGFMFGDGVYEMIPVFGDHIRRLPDHLARLRGSLAAIGVRNPFSDEQWGSVIREVLDRNRGARDRAIYVQVTRGKADRDHIAPVELEPTVFIMCREISERNYDKGVSAITHEDIRWQYGHIKAVSLLPAVLLKKEAKETDGSVEAILIRGGRVTEGAASNVFVVSDQRVLTPPKDGSLLAGVTRDLVVELLNANGIPCDETVISREALASADEIWITSSTMGIVPVVRLDGMPVGAGVPGAIWRRAVDIYEQYQQEPVSN